MRKSQQCLYEHDPAYRAWRDDQVTKVQEESLRRQGLVLAEALGQRFDNLVLATNSVAAAAVQASPAPATPAPVTPVPAAQQAPLGGVPAPVPEVLVPCEHGALNALHCKWLSAELGHRVELVPGEHAVVRSAIMAMQADRNTHAAVRGFLRKYAPEVRPPRSFADKVEAMLACVRDQ
jgi:hypothetical protein